MADETQLLCVVTPCYNEEEVIEKFYEALKPVLKSLPGLNHRIIFVDDGSWDRTLEKLNALGARDPAVHVYAFSRNFGHQIALSAGLDAARGDAVILMDSDLQHPPQLLPELLRQWEAGYQVVSAVRQHTVGVSWLKRVTSDSFYTLFNCLSDVPLT